MTRDSSPHARGAAYQWGWECASGVAAPPFTRSLTYDPGSSACGTSTGTEATAWSR
ncbi:hypothetical protein RB200_39370 [Streptomyces sp. PmtG]